MMTIIIFSTGSSRMKNETAEKHVITFVINTMEVSSYKRWYYSSCRFCYYLLLCCIEHAVNHYNYILLLLLLTILVHGLSDPWISANNTSFCCWDDDLLKCSNHLNVCMNPSHLLASFTSKIQLMY